MSWAWWVGPRPQVGQSRWAVLNVPLRCAGRPATAASRLPPSWATEPRPSYCAFTCGSASSRERPRCIAGSVEGHG